MSDDDTTKDFGNCIDSNPNWITLKKQISTWRKENPDSVWLEPAEFRKNHSYWDKFPSDQAFSDKFRYRFNKAKQLYEEGSKCISSLYLIIFTNNYTNETILDVAKGKKSKKSKKTKKMTNKKSKGSKKSTISIDSDESDDDSVETLECSDKKSSSGNNKRILQYMLSLPTDSDRRGDSISDQLKSSTLGGGISDETEDKLVLIVQLPSGATVKDVRVLKDGRKFVVTTEAHKLMWNPYVMHKTISESGVIDDAAGSYRSFVREMSLQNAIREWSRSNDNIMSTKTEEMKIRLDVKVNQKQSTIKKSVHNFTVSNVNKTQLSFAYFEFETFQECEKKSTPQKMMLDIQDEVDTANTAGAGGRGGGHSMGIGGRGGPPHSFSSSSSSSNAGRGSSSSTTTAGGSSSSSTSATHHDSSHEATRMNLEIIKLQKMMRSMENKYESQLSELQDQRSNLSKTLMEVKTKCNRLKLDSNKNKSRLENAEKDSHEYFSEMNRLESEKKQIEEDRQRALEMAAASHQFAAKQKQAYEEKMNKLAVELEQKQNEMVRNVENAVSRAQEQHSSTNGGLTVFGGNDDNLQVPSSATKKRKVVLVDHNSSIHEIVQEESDESMMRNEVDETASLNIEDEDEFSACDE